VGVALSVMLAVAVPNGGVLVIVAVSVGMTSGVAVGVLEGGGGGCVGVRPGVGLRVCVSVGVGSAGHPVSALFTALMSTSTVTVPSPFASKAGQTLSRRVPSAMLTPVITSSTVTSLESSQSPTHAGGWANAMRALSRTSKDPHATRRGNERQSMLQPVTRGAARNTQREKGGAQRGCCSPMPKPLPASGGSPRACRASFIAAR